ncbi:MAG: guanylate kinase [Candidatus Eremiobacteraeota bacterium]|nr:guanylate kinase [Candidatus Eremiobacteraeota bacterium]MBV8282028.1 guanylate kinase [Candidatus Eremiobacteraeota bacterium]
MEAAASRKPILLVVSGPSGSGKDSVIAALRTLEPRIGYCVSTTTRAARPGETEGVHYHFVTREAFEAMDARREFLETREYAGNLYGTPRAFVEDALRSGRDIVLKPEVNGAMRIKELYPQAVLVFLTVRSEDELVRRLEERDADGPDDIAARLETARLEAKAISKYDYLILNDEFDVAVAQLRAILTAEALKVWRLGETS